MRAMAVVAWMVMGAAPDAGVEAHARRRDIMLAELRCDDSDGGVFVERVHDCLVLCAGGIPSAVLLDGGFCFGPVKINPTVTGDVWAPGEWPYQGGSWNPPQSR